jgi:hypothetical protein
MIEGTDAMDQVLPKQRGLSRRAKLLIGLAGSLLIARGAHGRLRIGRRQGGGTAVVCWLPGEE